MSATPQTGATQQEQRCRRCGAPLDPAHEHCFHCGTPTLAGQRATRKRFAIGFVLLVIFCALMIVWLPRVVG